MGKESGFSMEMSFSVDVVYDDLLAIIGQFNQAHKDDKDVLSAEMLSCQQEAVKVLGEIKSLENKPTNITDFIAELNRKKDEGELREPTYDLIKGIL